MHKATGAAWAINHRLSGNQGNVQAERWGLKLFPDILNIQTVLRWITPYLWSDATKLQFPILACLVRNTCL